MSAFSFLLLSHKNKSKQSSIFLKQTNKQKNNTRRKPELCIILEQEIITTMREGSGRELRNRKMQMDPKVRNDFKGMFKPLSSSLIAGFSRAQPLLTKYLMFSA